MLKSPETAFAGLRAEGQPSGLAGTEMDNAFAYWRGASGRRYLFHVLPAEQDLAGIRSLNVVVILASRNASGEWIARWAGRGEDSGFDTILRRARGQGPVSIHVYGQAGDEAERRLIVDDIAQRMMPRRPYIPAMMARAA